MKAKDMKLLRKKIEKADRLNDPLKPLIGRAFGRYRLESTMTTTTTTTPLYELLLMESCNNTTSSSLTIQNFSSWQKIKPLHLFPDMMQLFHDNMGELYQSSSWGLDMEEKKEELQHRKARFLVATTTTTSTEEEKQESLVAFCHYRFDYDDDQYPTCAALYLYEIQISKAFQSQGIGQSLMLLLEDVARQADVSKTMLTVFHSNTGAMSFYINKLQYQIDETSSGNQDYEILSKSVQKDNT